MSQAVTADGSLIFDRAFAFARILAFSDPSETQELRLGRLVIGTMEVLDCLTAEERLAFASTLLRTVLSEFPSAIQIPLLEGQYAEILADIELEASQAARRAELLRDAEILADIELPGSRR